MAERKTKASEKENESTGEQAAKPTERAAGEQAAAKAPNAAPLAAPQPKPSPPPPPPLPPLPNAVTPHAPINDPTVRLLDEQGEELNVEDCLSYPSHDDPVELVTVTQRIFREFTPPHATTQVRRLVYPAGARITKADAKRLRDEMNPAPPAEGEKPAG